MRDQSIERAAEPPDRAQTSQEPSLGARAVPPALPAAVPPVVPSEVLLWAIALHRVAVAARGSGGDDE